jgi:PHD/YefM family antitoxin component YafN of YafNO toxin-antitoxin module
MDKTIGIAELRGSIASVIKEIHEDGAQYVVLQRSKAKAVILSPEKLETLEVMADKELLEDIRAAKEDILKGRYTSFEAYFGKRGRKSLKAPKSLGNCHPPRRNSARPAKPEKLRAADKNR